MEIHCLGFDTHPRIEINRDFQFDRILMCQPHHISRRNTFHSSATPVDYEEPIFDHAESTPDTSQPEPSASEEDQRKKRNNALALLGKNKSIPLRLYGRPRRKSALETPSK